MNIRVRGRPYEKCSICGANLDCGELCDCERQQKERDMNEKSGEDRIRQRGSGRDKIDHCDSRQKYI